MDARLARVRLPGWVPLALAIVLACVAGGLVAASGAGERAYFAFASIVADAGLLYLAWEAEPVWPISAGIALTIFSGNWQYLGFPIGADRLLLVTGSVAIILRALRTPNLLRSHPIQVLLVLTAGYALASGVLAGTIVQLESFFAWLDRLGVVPFLMFVIAPVALRTPRERAILLATLVATGAYLGLTALFETIGLDALVYPKYILDPTIGLHEDRARGPFVEAVANGLGLYFCAVAAAVALVTWRRPLARLAAGIVIVLCALGIVFTVTRAVWLGAILGTGVALLMTPATRRLVVPAAIGGVVLVLAALAVVPGLSDLAGQRSGDQLPVWDRLNTNRAGLTMLAERPLFGHGWDAFVLKSEDYLRQAEDYPLTGEQIKLHNVFLSNAVELGLVGFVLWATALLWALGGAILSRPPPELVPWRMALVAIAISWGVAAMFGPLAYALPTLLLWTLAGVLWAGRADMSPGR